jgi:hypothetical protein
MGLVLLRDDFSGPALCCWDSAVTIQTWHLFEHLLLFIQAERGFNLWGAREPTSVLQLFWPRIELHLFYNSIVTIPIVVAMILKWRQRSPLSPRIAVIESK